MVGFPCSVLNFGGDSGVPDMAIPGVNLCRTLHVCSSKVLSLPEDHQLPYLLDELSRLRVDLVGLSETRRPGSSETSSKDFTYYWSSMSNGHHVKVVAIDIPNRLQPSVVEVTPVDERIM